MSVVCQGERWQQKRLCVLCTLGKPIWASLSARAGRGEEPPAQPLSPLWSRRVIAALADEGLCSCCCKWGSSGLQDTYPALRNSWMYLFYLFKKLSFVMKAYLSAKNINSSKECKQVLDLKRCHVCEHTNNGEQKCWLMLLRCIRDWSGISASSKPHQNLGKQLYQPGS